MAVLYRALWHSSPEDVDYYLAKTRQIFATWATERSDEDPLGDGVTNVTLTRTRYARGRNERYSIGRSIALRSVGDPSADPGWEGITQETHDGMTWTTQVRIVATEGVAHTWVENQVESEQLVGLHLQVGRPRIVDDLLAVGNCYLGASKLQSEPLDIPPAGIPILVEHLRSSDRTLPVIVVSQPNDDDSGEWLLRASKIARRVSGVAVVATLVREAVVAFKRELGQLATWDGSIRVYAPVPVIDGEGYRHRYTLRGRLEDIEAGPSQLDRIIYGVCSISARRRPDAAFSVFTVAGQTAVDLSDYLSMDDVDAIIRELQDRTDAAESESLAAIADQDQLSRELSLKIGHLDRVHRALNKRGIFDLFYETQHDPGSGVPDEADSVDTAIILAMDFLGDWLVIHPDAPRNLDGINSAPQSGAWGNTTWRGLRALAAFAAARADGFAGSFYDWCRTGPPMGWPATDKKLSMTESEFVQNNSGLAGKRLLPVSTAVHDDGRISMLAHLKIAEGGGNLAPRVYFYDDTAGPTKKVHVGFIGPHYLMPNTKS